MNLLRPLTLHLLSSALVFFLLFLVVFPEIGRTFDVSTFSWIFVLTAIVLVVLRSRNNISPTSLYALHFYAIALFVGGRFFANVLDSSLNPFAMEFFSTYSLSPDGIVRLMSYILCGITAMEIGFYLSKPWAERKASSNHGANVFFVKENYLRFSFFIIAPLVGFVLFQSYLAVSQYGYLGLYLSQTQGAGSGLKSIVTTLTFVFLGIALTFGNKKTKTYYVILYFVFATANLLYGVRGGFVTFALFALWVSSDYGKRNLGVGRIFLGFLAIGIFIIYGMAFISGRGEVSEGAGIFEIVTKFLNDQGVTLMVFDLSTKIQDYPWTPYFQNILPGSAFIAGKITNVLPFETSFSSFLSYSNDYRAYSDGYGLGWSLFSDLYLYSGRFLPFFIVLCVIWGFSISKFEQVAHQNSFVKAVLISVAPAIIFLPRAGLNTVIPLALYTSFVILVFMKRNSRTGVRFSKSS